jgi:uncharacterized protein YrrD
MKRTAFTIALAIVPLAALAQSIDYTSIYTVTPEEFPTQQRMAAIIGQSAVSKDDHTVGEVSDVITDENQTVVGYLVDSGGYLDFGKKHVFVPKDQAIVRVDGISVELVIQLDATEFNDDVRLD